jgi:RNA polymerase sigma-70 factor (ECF subfamily)
VSLKEEGASDKGGSIKNVEDRVFTQELLNGIQVDYRVAMTLFYLEGKTVREISEILGIPQVLVKVRLHRARKQVLDKFGERV